ncbi:unnamed protein product [Kluyveromyces dobzhanskii CBS 2104]|uniref:WGS project CCBQ000000000 data, contig 00012 n=1 Tax=Kluyveromyces dobzhanskii CBS 2104 TaxID=1427455 RepID=A0A0A8L307_9SACH|nr:unnamed protein product [Kluyveromyces dobzhanskii CBS 2104]
MSRSEMSSAPKKRKRDYSEEVDEEITDPSSEEGDSQNEYEEADEVEELESEEEFEGENPADKRRRLAKQYLENLKAEAKDIGGALATTTDERDGSAQVEDYNNFDARDLDRDIIASRLKQDVAEQQGRVYRWISNKLLISESKTTFTRVGENNLTCISCYQPSVNKFSHKDVQNKNKDRIFAYTVSKDLQLTKYDVTDFKARPKKVKYVKGGKKYIPEGKFEFENVTDGHYDEILTVAASPDGKYVITGGRDRKLIVWSTESLAPVKVIPTKDRRGEILALAFRKNSDQLFAACADYKIRTYAINQFSQLEILYGHEDLVIDISALYMERCVTVGSRDRTAMLWKIADESRLTFRGGDDPERLKKKWLRNKELTAEDGQNPNEQKPPHFFGEGSIDCISMVDDSHFVTGSDNGNISLWSLSKKKPLFTVRTAHGEVPLVEDTKISGEVSEELRTAQLQDGSIAQPYWITSLYAIPYSDVFISGSWNGSLKVWKISENLREFESIGELSNCKGLVTRIQAVESGRTGRETLRILASVSKEHRLGRWINKVPGARNGIFSAVIEQTGF